jgi:N-acetylglucosamine-6-phosphate deacetylase
VLVLDAAKIVTPLRTFAPGRLIIEGGTVSEIGTQHDVRMSSAVERVDLSGLIVTPGFIDPHIHGCGGVDVMDGTYGSLNVISRIVARHGTTAFLPTTVSSPDDILSSAVEKLGKLMPLTFDGAKPLGIHLEGPFINSKKRGTHKASNVLAPNSELFGKWLRLSNNAIRLVTVAPELEGIDSILRTAAGAEVTVAMGHSNASHEEALSAANRGVCYAVHTFNAMREFTHREPGIAGTVLSDDRIFAEIIADGVHVNPAVIRIFARAKGKDRILLVTDATSATGMPDGRYTLGADFVDVNDGVCRDAEGRLAGSTLTQEIALKNLVAWTDLTFEEALIGLTLNPARALKLEKKGVLEPGADADLVVLDENFRVMHTYVGGRLVWTNLK